MAVSYLNEYLQKPGKEHLRDAGKSAPPTPTVYGVGPKVEIDVNRVRRQAEERFKAKHTRSQQKESQRITFPHGPVALCFVGDQHIGNAGTDVARMYREQEIIREMPGAAAWLTGDLWDNFVVGALQAENFKESLPIAEQVALGEHYVQGFGDKLVALNRGNHEAWSQKLTGIDVARQLVPEGVLYDGEQIKATVEVGSQAFKIWVRHKWRGSSAINPTHQLERAAREQSARFDIYVGAHTHVGSLYREFTLDGERKAAIQTGAYKIHDDYARSSGFPGSDHSTACAVVLHEDGTFFGCSSLEAIAHYMDAIYRAA